MEAYIGTICQFGFNFAPRNWAFCAGQIIAISSNTALFSLLGTTFGGNGTSTFGLPNFQGITPNGQGTGPGLSPYVMGQSAGNTTITLTAQNLPAHSHPLTVQLNANNNRATESAPANNFPAYNDTDTIYAGTPGNNEFMKGTAAFTINSQGGNQPMTIQRPYLTLNFCICQYGIFPSRN